MINQVSNVGNQSSSLQNGNHQPSANSIPDADINPFRWAALSDDQKNEAKKSYTHLKFLESKANNASGTDKMLAQAEYISAKNDWQITIQKINSGNYDPTLAIQGESSSPSNIAAINHMDEKERKVLSTLCGHYNKTDDEESESFAAKWIENFINLEKKEMNKSE